MPSPFPGMDPYLEHPGLWPDVHNALIAELRNVLAPSLRPRYLVRLEERTYVAGPEGLAFVGRPDLAGDRRSAEGANPPGPSEPSPAVPAAAGTIVVDVPVPATARESWLEVHAVAPPAGS